MKPKVVAIVGPTGCGKSALALDLAQRFEGEIISSDSMQVYRGMDIGTAKPSREERSRVRHHLIDIIDPDQEYSAAAFRLQADQIIHSLHERKVRIFVAGGTGLYLKALTRGLFSGPPGDPKLRNIWRTQLDLEGSQALHRQLQSVDPEAASRIHPRDHVRIIRALEVNVLSSHPISRWHREHGFRESPYHLLKIGLECEREELYRRIDLRTERMIAAGWVDEVHSLLQRGYSRNLKALQAIGYKQMVASIAGEMDLEGAILQTKRDTRRYAKRQFTWFKADSEIEWFDPGTQDLSGLVRRVAFFFNEEIPQENCQVLKQECGENATHWAGENKDSSPEWK